jgi:hypothetical protein
VDHSPPPAPVLDLAETLLAEEVARVRAETWSGILALSQGQVSKGLYFVDGDIAFAASTVEEDRLGAGLYRAGKIGEGQFRAAMRESESSGRHLGHTLVDMGFISPEDLAAAVAAQVERIVLSALRWTTGTMRREPMDRPLPPDLAVSLDSQRLLLLGLRQFPDASRLERALGPAERRLRRVSPPPFAYGSDPSLLPAERAILAVSSRTVTLAELLALPHARPELVRATYALVASGLLEDAPPRVAATVAPAPPAASLRPAEPSPSPAPVAAPLPLDLTPPPPPPATPEEAERTARALLERGQRPRAIEVLREAADRHPEARGPRRLLAMTLSRDAAFQGAVERLFLSLLESGPRDAELRYALASYYRRAGLPARALLQLRLVLSEEPGHAAAWRDLGELEAGDSRRGR